MLRAILVYLSKAPWARRLVTGWKFARRAAARFVVGDTLDEAVTAVRALNQRGLFATLDHLGENVTNPAESRRAAEDYLQILDRIAQSGIHSNASLKLTQLGLSLDFDLCLGNLRRIVRHAAELDQFVRLDMEDTDTVDKTFQVFRALQQEGLRNLGVAIQAYLYRSEADVAALLAEGARIRLCKGAYKPPADLAYPRKRDTDAAFDRLAEAMIDAAVRSGSEPAREDGRFPPVVALGTHDPKRIAHAKAYAAKVGLGQRALEFQMLHGIRLDLQKALAAEGFPVRVYVPFGTYWYPYTVRRLAERPANLWFFVSNFFRR